MLIRISVDNPIQLAEALTFPADAIYLDAVSFAPPVWQDTVASIRKQGKKAFLMLPAVYREKERNYFRKNRSFLLSASFDGLLLRTLEELELAAEIHFTGELVTDHTVYCFNRPTIEFVKSLGISRVTVPTELTGYEIRDTGFTGEEMVAYGHLRMMVSANCPYKTVGKCDGQMKTGYLQDRTGQNNIIRTACPICESSIYNGIPLCLADHFTFLETLSLDAIRLDFTVESREEMRTVLTIFKECRETSSEARPSFPFTHGAFLRKTS